jgi:hypothetical protein
VRQARPFCAPGTKGVACANPTEAHAKATRDEQAAQERERLELERQELERKRALGTTQAVGEDETSTTPVIIIK